MALELTIVLHAVLFEIGFAISGFDTMAHVAVRVYAVTQNLAS